MRVRPFLGTKPPVLTLTGVPTGTRSLLLHAYDADADNSSIQKPATKWLVYGMSPETAEARQIVNTKWIWKCVAVSNKICSVIISRWFVSRAQLDQARGLAQDNALLHISRLLMCLEVSVVRLALWLPSGHAACVIKTCWSGFNKFRAQNQQE